MLAVSKSYCISIFIVSKLLSSSLAIVLWDPVTVHHVLAQGPLRKNVSV